MVFTTEKISEKDTYGLCDFATATITISENQDSVEKSNTMLHEILHAIARDKGLELSDSLEERIVCAFSNGLTGFMRDNPKFFLQMVLAAIK